MATPIYDIASLDSVILSSQVTGIEHVIFSAVSEFACALATALANAVGMWIFQRWSRRAGSGAAEDDIPG